MFVEEFDCLVVFVDDVVVFELKEIFLDVFSLVESQVKFVLYSVHYDYLVCLCVPYVLVVLVYFFVKGTVFVCLLWFFVNDITFSVSTVGYIEVYLWLYNNVSIPLPLL